MAAPQNLAAALVTAETGRDDTGTTLVLESAFSPEAFDQGQAVVLMWAIDQATGLRERLADLVQLAFLDGMEAQRAEMPPPPGIAAAGYRIQLLDLFDPFVDELRAHATSVLARIGTSDAAGTIDEDPKESTDG